MRLIQLLGIYLVFNLLNDCLNAQPSFYRADQILVIAASDTLSFPFTGGFNNPQFYAVDLNNDNFEDLYVFDRGGSKSLTFINQKNPGQLGYDYAPQFETVFPEIENWAFAIDWNCDQIPDIFTFRKDNRASLYTGARPNGDLEFSLTQDTVKYEESSFIFDLFVNKIDIPCFIDVNEDGDLDVLTFHPAGGFLEYFENRSIERYGNCDHFELELVDKCWGRFYESGLNRTLELDTCGTPRTSGPDDPVSRHSGSTVMALDINGDMVKEVVLGDLNFNNLNLLNNTGTLTNALITSQDTSFPKNSIPVDLPLFPAGFHLDVDNDNLMDIIAVPNSRNSSRDLNNIWLYKNTGTANNAVFTFQNNNSFIKETIDHGSVTYPVFFDHNNDGLLDMLTGYRSKMNGNSVKNGSIAYYENIGTAESPVFKWVTDDYQNISSYNLFGISPTFGDMDDDGDTDMIIGDEDGKIHYFENKANPGDPASFPSITPFYFGMDIGNNSTPQLADVNGNGKFDLVVGEKNGNLNYYENSGTKQLPQFPSVPDNGFFGEVDVRRFGNVIGYSYPFLTDIDSSGTFDLLVGSLTGNVYHYTGLENNLNGKFNLQDSLFEDIDVGERSGISGADINADGLTDVILGNSRGGLTIYYQEKVLGFSPHHKHRKLAFELFPNPTDGKIFIKLNEIGPVLENETYISIKGITGNRVLEKILPKGLFTDGLDIELLGSGIYLISVSNGNFISHKRIILQKRN